MALDFTFNAWGERFTPYHRDAALAETWAAHQGHPHRRIPLVFEGGATKKSGNPKRGHPAG